MFTTFGIRQDSVESNPQAKIQKQALEDKNGSTDVTEDVNNSVSKPSNQVIKDGTAGDIEVFQRLYNLLICP